MHNALSNIRLKYQLILLLALPTLVILSFSFKHVVDNWSHLQEVHRIQAIESLNSHLKQLINSLQRERGLSAGYIGSNGANFANSLLLQRTATDKQLASMSTLISWSESENSLREYGLKLDDLQQELKSINTLRNEVDSLIFTTDFFKRYTHLIEFIITHIRFSSTSSSDITLGQKRQELMDLIWLQEYAGIERGMLSLAFSSGNLSSPILQWVVTSGKMQSKLLGDIESIGIEHKNNQPITQLLNDPSFSTINTIRQNILQKSQKDELLNRIQVFIGYGGMIQDFKNYLIRGDSKYKDLFQLLFRQCKQIIERYRNIPGLSEDEQRALNTIESTFQTYSDKLDIIEKNILNPDPQSKLSHRQLDRVVQVNDKPALAAIGVLQQGFGDVEPQQWFEQASKRINLLINHQNELYNELQAYLSRIETDSRMGVVYTILVLLLLIIATALIGYIILYRLTSGIHSIAMLLQKVHETGDLSTSVNISGRDELGLMATSLNQLLMERKWINHELELHRNRLEEMVEEKTCELNQQQAINRSIIETSLDGIITVNQHGRVVDFNPAAEQIFQYCRQQTIGRPIAELIIPEQLQDAHHEGFSNALRMPHKQLGKRYEVDAKRADGTTIPIEIAMGRTIIGDETLFTAYLRDISERLQDQRELEEARDRADFANQAKSEFLANMSHELRTPMHAILSFSEMGNSRIDKVSREKLGKYFKQINSSGKRLLVLLNDLLDLAKLESGKMQYTFAKTELYPLFQELIGELHSLLEVQSIELIFHAPGFEATIEIDPGRITQVMKNLLSNAIKFTPSGGEIHIMLTEDLLPADDPANEAVPAIKITVCDQGIGIPEDELDSVFDKFIQSSSSNTGAGGTGLGLPISKEIIAAHHGTIWAENNNGEAGCCFHFLLPRSHHSG